MKHTHRIIRLLTLAVVSCALAALLSGCTKEEFIAGYNEFLFGDWFPSPPSAGETTSAEGSASGDSGHVYAEPNPECDAKISSLMSELYSLESSARSDVSSAIQSAKDEYHALPALSGPLPIKSASPTSIFPRWRAPTTVPSPRWSARCAVCCGSITSPKP